MLNILLSAYWRIAAAAGTGCRCRSEPCVFCTRCDAIGLFDELCEGEFRRAVYGHKEIQLAFPRLYFGDIDVKEADRVGFEFLSRACRLRHRQTADPMSLQAAMQR